MLPAVEYQRLARDEVTCVAQLESREAVTAAADIAATPGMGALFVGPADLSVSTGLPPDSAEFAGLLKTVEQAAREVDVPLGTASGDARQVKRLVERGYAFVLLSSDATMLGGLPRHWSPMPESCSDHIFAYALSLPPARPDANWWLARTMPTTVSSSSSSRGP